MNGLRVLTVGLVCSSGMSVHADDSGEYMNPSKPVRSVVGSLEGSYTDNSEWTPKAKSLIMDHANLQLRAALGKKLKSPGQCIHAAGRDDPSDDGTEGPGGAGSSSGLSRAVFRPRTTSKFRASHPTHNGWRRGREIAHEHPFGRNDVQE